MSFKTASVWSITKRVKNGLMYTIVTLTAVLNGQVMNVQTALFVVSFRRVHLLQSTLQKIVNGCKIG